MPDTPQAPAGIAEWCELSEALLRGLVHALNNRLTALSAFAELSAMGDSEFAADKVMPAELARMQQVSGLFRLLVSDPAGAEALEVGPVLDDVLALHAHHPVLRGQPLEVVRDGPLMPVRAPRWALLRLMLVLVESAQRAAVGQGGGTTMRIGGDEHRVTLHVPGASATPYALAMAHLCGAALAEESGAAVVRIASLLELRRLERELSGSTRG